MIVSKQLGAGSSFFRNDISVMDCRGQRPIHLTFQSGPCPHQYFLKCFALIIYTECFCDSCKDALSWHTTSLLAGYCYIMKILTFLFSINWLTLWYCLPVSDKLTWISLQNFKFFLKSLIWLVAWLEITWALPFFPYPSWYSTLFTHMHKDVLMHICNPSFFT